jgi:hypothetical protein
MTWLAAIPGQLIAGIVGLVSLLSWLKVRSIRDRLAERKRIEDERTVVNAKAEMDRADADTRAARAGRDDNIARLREHRERRRK